MNNKKVINNKKILELFSKHLFWDIDIKNIDIQKHKKFIIKKVLQYGTYNDWKIIRELYGQDTIITISKTIRDLDNKTISFLSVISDTPKSEFICYTTKQSTQQHWNF